MTTAAATPQSRTFTLVAIAYFSFIVMGMPIALIGVVWEGWMQSSFNLSLGDVSAYYLCWTIGYFLASFISGRLNARFGSGTLLAAACLIGGVALFGVAAAQSWLLLACAIVFGLCTGIQDAGLNIIFAARYNARLMNWLHACFGIGTTVAPLLATALFTQGFDWRASYFVIAALFIAAAFLFYTTRQSWLLPISNTHSESAASGSGSLLHALRMPLVWLGMGMFFMIAAAESSVGNWASPFLQNMRGVAEITAGAWVSAYWASFTIGRIIFGALNLPFKPDTLLRIVAVTGILGAVLYSTTTVPELSLVALLMMGFSVAPMFPMLITATQARFDEQQAANAIGVQVAAASVGVGLMPGLAGILADAQGLQVIPPFALVLFIVFFVLHAIAARMSQHKHNA
jgi:fucose permease